MGRPENLLYAAAIVLGAGMIVATALPLLRRNAWWIRICDFPRLQVSLLAAAALAAFVASWGRPNAWELAFAALLAASLGYQAFMMFPYTFLARRQVEDASSAGESNTIGIVFANVLISNRDASRLLAIVEEEQPDVILAVENDQWWQGRLDVLARTYPHVVRQPQENSYGMALYSRLELLEPKVKFLVQNDVPSIHARVRLRNGAEVDLRCLHPRPPAPGEAKDSRPRDAELIVVGKELRGRKTPCIVLGDLNDVAWSRTNYRFQELSGLLARPSAFSRIASARPYKASARS
jgi:endonuclease/exonuclease/phosphatase (EEP) superfamily protein YafD